MDIFQSSFMTEFQFKYIVIKGLSALSSTLTFVEIFFLAQVTINFY